MNHTLTLPLLSKINKKAIAPFWDDACQDLHTKLWLPGDNASLTKTDQSRFWMKRRTPTLFEAKAHFHVDLPASSIEPAKASLPENGKIIASKKVRFYPDNATAYHDALCLYRRAYNLAVERFVNGTYKDEAGKSINLRMVVKKQVEKEQTESGRAYNSLICDHAVMRASNTFSIICAKNKKSKGQASGLSRLQFKSRKGAIHSFGLDRLPKGLAPCVRSLGKIHLTEPIPSEALGKSCTITFNKGRWFIQVQQHIPLQSEIQGEVKCVAIDPGVRTFATCFSPQDVIVAGENFARDKLFPLMLKVDGLLGQRQKLLNVQKDVPLCDMPQWARDRLTYLNRQIDRLKCKKDDLTLDLHNRLAYELVTHYDVIFLPTFETRGMVSRKGTKVRTLRRNTCRQMLDLNHYQFKLRLKWYARKYGKHLVDCNESHTSKTRSWSGVIDERLGSSKTIKDGDIRLCRDINGARNIFIKCLQQAA